MNINPVSPRAAFTPPTANENTGQEIRQSLNAQASQGTQKITAQAVSQTSKTEATRDELENATKAMNEFVAPINSAIQFALDDETGTTVVKVIDVTTKDVIRQIPSEEMLSIAKAIDKVKGLLVQQKV